MTPHILCQKQSNVSDLQTVQHNNPGMNDVSRVFTVYLRFMKQATFSSPATTHLSSLFRGKKEKTRQSRSFSTLVHPSSRIL
jgi:hypothetical protein